VSIDDVFATLGAYLGSSYVDQFNKFGRVFQVYVQADSRFRLRPQDIEQLPVRNKQGAIIPIAPWFTSPRSSGRPCSASTTSIRLRR